MEYYIHVVVHEYYGMISTALIIHINCLIKDQLCSACNLLKHPITFEQNLYTVIRTNEFEKAYNRIMVILKDFNYVFGYQIMFIIGYSAAVILNSICNVLKAIDFNNIVDVLILIGSTINAVMLLVIFHAINIIYIIILNL